MLIFPKLVDLPRPIKTAILALGDATMAVIAVWLTVMLRTGGLPNLPLYQILLATAVVMLLVPVVASLFGIYRLVLRFASPGLIARVALASTVSGLILGGLGRLGGADWGRSAGLGVVFGLVLFTEMVLARVIARVFLSGFGGAAQRIPVAIYGAGSAGHQLAAMLRKTAEYLPVAFLDDAPGIQGRMVEALPVWSPKDARLAVRLQSRGVQQICLAIPSLTRKRRREILDALGSLPIRVRSVPRPMELLSGTAPLDRLADVTVEDLLGRDTVPPIHGLLERCIHDKTVLITGGGGSIGSELCRQVFALQPRHLIVLDHSEIALYQIGQELNALAQKNDIATRLSILLGSVVDDARVRSLFAVFDVDTVYHAAAYKHVPIVEFNAEEGMRNNVLGTWKLARAAADANVRHFVLISTDKAVRPTNVMGATKRVAELVVQAMAEQYPEIVFSMVRFGNVLDSSGSVVPLFRKQIEAGGPITLTHLEVTRFFMTISEAVQLTIQAGAMAHGSDVFVLDMGEAVKIRDLAIKMIHLSGLTVRDGENLDGDIAIEVTGLRPGEKLYEELLIGGDVLGTAHPRIMRSNEQKANWTILEKELEGFERSSGDYRTGADVIKFLEKWVAGYGRMALTLAIIDDRGVE